MPESVGRVQASTSLESREQRSTRTIPRAGRAGRRHEKQSQEDDRFEILGQPGNEPRPQEEPEGPPSSNRLDLRI